MNTLYHIPKTKNGFTNLFTARCYATKFIILVRTKDRTLNTAAKCIFENIVCRFGVPEEIVSDRAFVNDLLKEYLKVLDTQHLPSASYTPRTTGTLERGHREVNNIITKLCNGDPTRWDEFVPLTQFILNARINNATGFSAFYLCHGLEPRIPGDELPVPPP